MEESDQRSRWDDTYAKNKDFFGAAPSDFGWRAAERMKEHGVKDVLELGCGQGRDTLYFARSGFEVHALDVAAEGVAAIRARATEEGHSGRVTAARHDCRDRLPLADRSVDACFSHMLLCMALSTPQLEALSTDVHRVLRPGGLHVYTARSTADPDYGGGASCGDDMYESGGFVVHFFSPELVERLARGYELVDVTELEEGDLPRRLFRVTMRRGT